MAKGLTRKITRKQALSYRRTHPNGLGVTAIARVNGRRSKARRGPPAVVKKAMKACGKLMKSAWKSAKRRTAKRNPRAGSSYDRRYAATKAVLRGGRSRARRNSSGAAPTTAKAKAQVEESGMKPNKKRRRQTAKQRAASMKNLKKARAAQKRGGGSKRRKGAARRKKRVYVDAAGRKYGKGRKKARRASTTRKGGRKKARASLIGGRVSVRVGGRTMRTFLERTKRGGVRHMPRWKILGFKSQSDMNKKVRKSSKTMGRVVAREQGIRRARERAAERVLKHGDIFTPNTKVVSYSQWRENMKRNGRKRRKGGSRRRQTAKQRAASLRNLRKARAARRRRKSGKKKPARRTRRASARKRKGGKRRTYRRNKSKKRRTGGRKRRSGGKKRRRSSKRRAAPRRTKRRSSKRRASPRRRRKPTKKSARRAAKTLTRYVSNRRRRRSRRYRRNIGNGAFMRDLKAALKLGAVVVGGFLAHKAATKLLADEVLSKVEAFNTGSLAPWRNLVAGAITAAAGIGLAAKFLSPTTAKEAAGGVGASFLHAAVIALLSQANQPKMAGYFAAYPDAEGRAYHGYGEYFLPGQGLSEYELAGFGQPIFQAAAGLGQPIMQAAAGMGQPIMQAAAGMGQAAIMQAAAGTGEYLLTGGEAYGEYEMQPPPAGTAGVGYVDEGIMGGDLSAAEYALNQAEAAAGIGGMGDIPTQSIWMPEMLAVPVEDAPGGMRAGILQGGDGIFG